MATPTGFIPQQDKGYLLVNVRLPDSASLDRTEQVMQRIEKTAGKSPGVKHTVAIAGQSVLLGANAPNFGTMYVMLDDFHHRAQGALVGRRDRRSSSRKSSRPKSRKGWSTSSAPRRSMAWARLAASRS